jgi:hypothetical protein
MGVLEQIAIKWDHFMIRFNRVNLLDINKLERIHAS